MSRRAMESFTLSDGTRIPKGAYLQVPTFDMPDGDRWGPNKHKFDGRRFLDLRNQPGQENRWQFVTTSAEHLGFGHGQHACPGRFFASNEIKIAIAHLLLAVLPRISLLQVRSLLHLWIVLLVLHVPLLTPLLALHSRVLGLLVHPHVVLLLLHARVCRLQGAVRLNWCWPCSSWRFSDVDMIYDVRAVALMPDRRGFILAARHGSSGLSLPNISS